MTLSGMPKAESSLIQRQKVRRQKGLDDLRETHLAPDEQFLSAPEDVDLADLEVSEVDHLGHPGRGGRQLARPGGLAGILEQGLEVELVVDAFVDDLEAVEPHGRGVRRVLQPPVAGVAVPCGLVELHLDQFETLARRDRDADLAHVGVVVVRGLQFLVDPRGRDLGDLLTGVDEAGGDALREGRSRCLSKIVQ
jgi:hypothetical protein